MPQRITTLTHGRAMIVTDLHGAGAVYDRLRDKFLEGYKAGDLHHFVICGDLIHHNGSDAEDESLRMLLDVMRLRRELGDAVVMLCGNHEMPHIYGMPLSRGHIEYTPRFERALVELENHADEPYNRDDVINFLMDLPFYAFTAAGVMLTHAGPVKQIQLPEVAKQVAEFDHRVFLQQIDNELNQYDLVHAHARYAINMGRAYDGLASHYLAVTDENDPRYNHLLRSFVYSGKPEFELLWATLFSRNENEFPNDMRRVVDYADAVTQFLQVMSEQVPAYPQHIVLSGHISVHGGHHVVDDTHLRIATYEHASPAEAGQYLILDVEAEVEDADALVPMLHRTSDIG
ncbi:MAG: metallophosphoesterase [Chloroflexota bacterium]